MIRKVLLTIVLSCLGTARAIGQSGEPSVFAGVISTKLFVVGAANPETGLFYQKPFEDTVWHHTGAVNIRVNGLAVFPGSRGRLLYVASGNGLHVSTNSGASWKITTGWEVTEVLTVAPDPRDSSTVYIGTAYGIYKSADACATWTKVHSQFISSVIVDHANSSVLFASTETGVYKSTDTGVSWSRTGLSIDRTRTISQHPHDANILFVGTENHGIYSTTNGGMVWTKSEAGIDHLTFYTIAFDPSNPQILYAGGYATGVYKSTNGGSSWTRSCNGLDIDHVRSIVVDPSRPERVFAGTLGNGVYRSIDAGRTWQWTGLRGAQIGKIVIEP